MISPEAGSRVRVDFLTPLGSPRWRGPLWAGAAFALIFWIVFIAIQGFPAAGDAEAYLAAGERLNAGRDLYTVQPGDRLYGLRGEFEVYGGLFYPPTIAALWRPLAALGPWTVWVWWAAMAGAAVLAIVLRKSPGLTILLALPLAYSVLFGNVVLLIVLVMVAYRPTRRWAFAAGFLAALKPTAVPFAAYTLRDDPIGTIAGVVAAVAMGVVGAGPAAYADYLGVVVRLQGLETVWAVGTYLGPQVQLIVTMIGPLIVVLTRRWPIAVVLCAFGTSAASTGGLASLLAIRTGTPGGPR